MLVDVLAASRPAPYAAGIALFQSDTKNAPIDPKLLSSRSAILCFVMDCAFDISVLSCCISSLSHTLSLSVLMLTPFLVMDIVSNPPVINGIDGTISKTSRTPKTTISGFLSVSHLRKLYSIIHSAMDMNLNIHRYWLPGSIFNTGYIAVAVHISVIIAVTKPALDFLYPKNIPPTASIAAASPK